MWRGAYPCTPHSTKAEARACKVRDLPNLHIKTLAMKLCVCIEEKRRDPKQRLLRHT